jgi:tRNA pseudouridine38-40 synthase
MTDTAAESATPPDQTEAADVGEIGVAEPTVRLRLDLAYDGTDFFGWAAQPGLRTVQGVVEQTLQRVLRLEKPPTTTCAGRTDAGVHARGQVCHVDVPAAAYAAVSGRSSLPPAHVLTRRLAGALPADVRVRRVEEAPDGFDARFSALWRRYAYRICDDPAVADPLRRREVLDHPRRLDHEAMNDAARRLLGEHDFAAFCRAREGATTVRTLLELSWDRDATGLLVARVIADAFCHSMVRALVGALLRVGEGRRPVEWPAQVLAARVRDPAVPVVPARGLTLEEVAYPPANQLAARAALTRRVRTHPGDDRG